MWQRAKRLVREAGHRAKVAVSADDRGLPDFVIVGAQKAGTTSLFHCLRQHPRVVPPSSKEVHFFDLNHGRGLAWYRGHFCLERERAALMARHGRPVMTFEASPYYMYHPLAIERMAEALPGVRAIAMLRHPVERTWSHYWHERRKGREPLDFEAALAAEPERLRGAPACVSHAHQHHSYVGRSLYAPQVERLIRVLGRDRVCLVRSEAFFADPARETARVLAFLGLPPAPGIDYGAKNAGAYEKAMPLDVARRLEAVFTDDVRRLREIAGPGFEWFGLTPS